MSTVLEAVSLATLPALKQPLEGGTFCGVITLPEGGHYAVILLNNKPSKRMPWKKAMEWAKSVGGRLPSRAIAALLFSVAKDLLDPTWHWTDEPDGSSYAWSCDFSIGYQTSTRQSYEGGAVAVRLIPLAP